MSFLNEKKQMAWKYVLMTVTLLSIEYVAFLVYVKQL